MKNSKMVNTVCERDGDNKYKLSSLGNLIVEIYNQEKIYSPSVPNPTLQMPQAFRQTHCMPLPSPNGPVQETSKESTSMPFNFVY